MKPARSSIGRVRPTADQVLYLEMAWVPAWSNTGGAPSRMASSEDCKVHSQHCKSILFASLLEGDNREEAVHREGFRRNWKMQSEKLMESSVDVLSVLQDFFRPVPSPFPIAKKAKQPKSTTTTISHDRFRQSTGASRVYRSVL